MPKSSKKKKKKQKQKQNRKQYLEELEFARRERLGELMEISVGDLRLLLDEFGFGLGIGPTMSRESAEEVEEVRQSIGFQPNDE